MGNDRSSDQQRIRIATAIAIGCFIGIRLAYWRITYEVPFSDMADYFDIARRVLCCFEFSHSGFWQSYKPPTLPLIGSLAFLVGGDNPLGAWQIIQLIITLGSLLWFAKELSVVTGRAIFGVSLLFVVALSKSSIFWSYKFATEGLTEAFSYLLIAATLFVLRRERHFNRWFFFLGVVYTAGFLLRPNMISIVPAFLLLWFILKDRRPGRKTSRVLGAFLLGILLTWSPWLARGYWLYGHIVPLSTQGPYSFIWEFGEMHFPLPDGTIEKRNVNQLQEEAWKKFSTDYESSRYAAQYAKVWLKANWKSVYPALLVSRCKRMLFDRDISLSKVPRSPLFPGYVDRFLLDKKPVLLVLGVLGLGMLFLLSPERLFIIPIVTLCPVLFTLIFLGDARFLEPSLPLILYGNVALVISFWTLLRNYSRH